MSGANLSLLEYLKLLKEDNFEIYLITPRLGEFTNRAANYVVKSYEIYFYSWCIDPAVKLSFPARLRRIIRNHVAKRQAGKIIKEIGPDYIATNTITIDIGALTAKRYSVKHLWFVHEFGELDHGFTFKIGMDKARKKIISLSHLVVVNSLAVLNSFPVSDKLKLIYYSITNQCPVINKKEYKSSFRVVMLGQIARSKNQAEAIRAIGLCREKGYNITLSIYGNIITKDYYDFLENIIKKNLLDNFVTFHSQTGDICKPLRESHALLMCSGNEAFGRVTVEALKAGLPVIAAQTGGSLEIIDDGINGYFYEPGNVAGFADKIIDMYNNYIRFDSKKISANITLKFNETNTRKQLKKVFN